MDLKALQTPEPFYRGFPRRFRRRRPLTSSNPFFIYTRGLPRVLRIPGIVISRVTVAILDVRAATAATLYIYIYIHRTRRILYTGRSEYRVTKDNVENVYIYAYNLQFFFPKNSRDYDRPVYVEYTDIYARECYYYIRIRYYNTVIIIIIKI